MKREREEVREEVREYRSYGNDEGAFKLRGCMWCVRQRMDKLMRLESANNQRKKY